MGRIADEIIQQIRDRIDIVDLVGRHLTLKKSGRNHVGLCPFHNEKTPSFNVNSDRQSYYCFGCHEGGTVFSFLMHVENLTFPEAVRALGRECGVDVPETSGGERSSLEPLYRANEIAQAEYRRAISVPGNPAFAYTSKRGLDTDDVATFEIGFAPDSWDTVANALRAEGISGEIGARAGLLAERRSGGYYDRMRGRLTFPIRDVRGRVIGFGGRALSPDQEPKYLNTPEGPVFHKRQALFGYPGALAPMRSAERAVVVEGYFDQIALVRAGIGGAVATCGTALTAEHVRDLRRRTKEVVLLFDGDEAGHRALTKALEILIPEGIRVRAAVLPPGDDPDTFLVREGADALAKLVGSAPPALDFVIRRAAARGHGTAWETADAVSEVVPLLSLIPGVVERSEFGAQLALAVGVEPRHIEEAVRAERRGLDPRDAIPAAPRKRGPEDRIASQLLRSLIEYPALVERIDRDELLSLLPSGPTPEMAEKLWERRPVSLDVETFCEDLSPAAATLARELASAQDALDEATAARVLDDTVSWLRKRAQKRRGQALTEQLRNAGEDWRSILEAKRRERTGNEASSQGNGYAAPGPPTGNT